MISVKTISRFFDRIGVLSSLISNFFSSGDAILSRVAFLIFISLFFLSIRSLGSSNFCKRSFAFNFLYLLLYVLIKVEDLIDESLWTPDVIFSWDLWPDSNCDAFIVYGSFDLGGGVADLAATRSKSIIMSLSRLRLNPTFSLSL